MRLLFQLTTKFFVNFQANATYRISIFNEIIFVEMKFLYELVFYGF